MEQEIWKVYKETNSLNRGHRVYEVSNLGHVKFNGKLLTFDDKKVYYRIGNDLLHRAVAELFIPNPENKPCVDHINGDKHDNRDVNLRWVTYKENMNNPITKNYMTSPEFKIKRHPPEANVKRSISMKNRRHMSNGIKSVYVKLEKVDYYLEKGYHFGRK